MNKTFAILVPGIVGLMLSVPLCAQDGAVEAEGHPWCSRVFDEIIQRSFADSQ